MEEKDIGLEPEPLPCHTGMGCPPLPRKGRREADWTAAAERILLAAEETIFSISLHCWQHLRHGHLPPPTTLTSHSATPHLLLTSSSSFLFPPPALHCPLGFPHPLSNPLLDAMLVLIGNLPLSPAAITVMMTARIT